MDDTKFITDLVAHWPTLAWAAPVLIFAFYALKFLALAYDPVAKILGSTGRKWRESAERKQKRAAGEVGLLREEVKSLSCKVDDLQKRDAIYWAYVMYDQEWHRDMQMKAIENNWDVKRHLSFLEFRAKWWIDNPDQQREVVEDERPF